MRTANVAAAYDQWAPIYGLIFGNAFDSAIALLPVAAILVASIRLPFFHLARNVRDSGEGARSCNAQFAEGSKMDRFEHGSTIIVLTPPECRLVADFVEGRRISMGEALITL